MRLIFYLRRISQSLARPGIYLILAGLVLFLAGCYTPVQPARSSPATPEPIQTYSPKVIPFFTTETDPAQITLLQAMVAEYQHLQPDVEIEITLASPGSRGRRLLTALASGADLGIFEIEPTLITEWIEAGYLLPLDDVAGEIGLEDDVAGSLFYHQDPIYAIPYAISVYGLWVRTDLLTQAGLPLPKTYDQVLEAARTLTRDDQVYGIALPAGQNIAFLRGRVAMSMYAGRLGANIAAKAPDLEEHVTVIFLPWGPEKVTLGVWSRLAIAAGTRHQAEAKAFLQWLVSGDRLLRYDMTVPGHMIPPLKTVQAKSMGYDTPYVTRHPDWLHSFNDWVVYTNHPAMNMGSIRQGRFVRSEVAPPWSSVVFSTPGIIDNMLQEITLGERQPEAAWRDAVSALEKIVSQWKAQHPAWQPPECRES